MPSPNLVLKESDVKEKTFGRQISRYEKGNLKKKSLFVALNTALGRKLAFKSLITEKSLQSVLEIKLSKFLFLFSSTHFI